MSFEKQLKTVPLLKLLVPYCIGIGLQNYFHWPCNVLCYVLYILLCCLLLFHYLIEKLGYREAAIWYIIIFNAFIMLGCLNVSVKRYLVERTENKLKNAEALIGSIASEPIQSKNKISIHFHIEQLKSKNGWEKIESLVLMNLYFTNIQKIELGQKIALINPKVQLYDNDYFPHQFKYIENNKKKGVIGIISLYKKHQFIFLKEYNQSIQYSIQKFRNHIITKVGNYINQKREMAVLSSLVLGYRAEIDSDLKLAYTTAGVMHILSVSGLHVGIVYLFLSYTLFFLKNKPKWKIFRMVLILLGIWFYALLTRNSPPVLRSTLMFSFFALGELMDRQIISFNMVFVSAFFMLAFSPYLLFDIGFQLSYAALIGILIFYKPFCNLLQFSPIIPTKITELAAVSCAAQLGTLPFSFLYFHTFPTYFIISNIIIVPLSAVCLYGGLILIALLPFQFLARLFAHVIEWLIYVLNTIILKIDNLPMASIQLSYFNIVYFIGLFILIGILAYIITFKNFKWILGALTTIIIMQISNLFNNYYLYNKKELIIGKINLKPYLALKQSDKLFIFHYTTDCNYIKKISDNYIFKNKVKSIHFINLDSINERRINDFYYTLLNYNQVFTLVTEDIGIIFSSDPLKASELVDNNKSFALFKKIKLSDKVQYYLFPYKTQLNIKLYTNYHIINY